MKTGYKFQVFQNLTLIVVFSLIITIQFWWPLTGFPDAEKSEIRALAKSPDEFTYKNYQQISSYPIRFENHFVDTFPVRYQFDPI